MAAAIAQHHERLDGIGYPLGLKDEQIGRLARVLMLVEVILAILERPSGKEQLQLSMTLRLNHRSFDRVLSEIVLRALPRADEFADAPRHSHEELDRAIALMVAWSDLRTQRDGKQTSPAFEFIDAQVARLRRWMAETGFDFANPGQVDATGKNEPQVTAEIHALGNEALWQARQIARDAQLRWPQLRSQGAAEAADILQTAVTEWIAEALKANVLAGAL